MIIIEVKEVGINVINNARVKKKKVCLYYANDLTSYDRLVNLKLRLKIS